MTARILILLVTVLTATGVHADGGRPFAAPSVVSPVAPSGVGSLGQVTLALALVLAAIFAAAWLLRRVRGFGRARGTTLEVIADLPLGPKERALLVRVGTTQLLLGVAPGRVSTLHVLAEPLDTGSPALDFPPGTEGAPRSAPAGERPTFRSLLMKSLGRS